MCIAGVVGLTLGSGLSYKLRSRIPWIDPGKISKFIFIILYQNVLILVYFGIFTMACKKFVK